MKGTLKIEKNIAQFDKKPNAGLNYYTSSLTFSDNTSKEKIIKSIDNYILKFIEKNKYKLDLVQKDPKIKALKRFKKILLSNDGDSMINGRVIPKPNEKTMKKINEIKNKNFHKKKKSSDNFFLNTSKEKDDLSFSK